MQYQVSFVIDLGDDVDRPLSVAGHIRRRLYTFALDRGWWLLGLSVARIDEKEKEVALLPDSAVLQEKIDKISGFVHGGGLTEDQVTGNLVNVDKLAKELEACRQAGTVDDEESLRLLGLLIKLHERLGWTEEEGLDG